MTHLRNPPNRTAIPSAELDVASVVPAQGTHSAYFYSVDTVLAAEVARRLGGALSMGGAGLVIASSRLRDAVAAHLRDAGMDLTRLAEEGLWLELDAEQTLADFMVEGWPDADRFRSQMGSILDSLAAATGNDSSRTRPVTAYGEMVAVLWEQGRTGASLRVEKLWNEVARTRRFDLTCGWPLRFFSHDTDGSTIRRICSEHNHVAPGQDYDSMSDDERRRSTILWQLKAQALEEETRRGRETRQTLRLREAELRDFLENAAIGMHWLAPDGTILWANQSELSLLGYQPQQYVGRNFAEFAEDPGVVDSMLRRMRKGGSIRGEELRLRSSDQSLRWVRIDATPWSHKRKFLHARCFVLDIGEKKRADEAQLKLAAIVESSDDAIISKDLKGIVTSWNAAAERILGYKAEEIIGRPVTTLIPPELHQDEVEILRRIQAGQRIDHFETVRLTKGGERIDVSLTISPVRDPQGRIAGAAKILRDVTMQKNLEAALRTTEQLAAVGRLAATIAHEINNPLEAVTNLIYLARQNRELPESARACLIVADEELQRVTHIARQTLGFYRDTSAPVWISVPESVDEMLAIYHRRVSYKQIRLRARIPAELRLRARQGEFKQIFSNLISNAIDASPQAGMIDIRAWPARHPLGGASGITLVVADRGCGIPEPIRTKIFTPFFTTKKDVGTGLGLWIVQGMLIKSGGFIRCRSRVASGDDRRSGTAMMAFLPNACDAGTNAELRAA